MKFEQDLCKSTWYDFKKLLWKDELNPRVRCAFGNVFLTGPPDFQYQNEKQVAANQD